MATINLPPAMTITQATSIQQQGNELLACDDLDIDFSAVKEVDSSALAVLFTWQRFAARNQRSINLTTALPQGIITLAEVYSVSDLLPKPAV